MANLASSRSDVVAASAWEQPSPRYRVVSNRTGQVLTPLPISAVLAVANVRYLARRGFDVRLERQPDKERDA